MKTALKETKTCKTCSIAYEPRPREGVYLWGKRKYCSIRCHYDRNLNKSKLCKYCNMIFSPTPRKAANQFDKRIFCSVKCVVKNREEQYKNGKPRIPSTHSFGRGKNNPNWKGGVTPENEKLRKTSRYKNWRKAVFERDNYTCQFCSVRGGDLNADHIKPFAFYPEHRFDVENGRTLCVPCHRTTFFGNKNEVEYERIS